MSDPLTTRLGRYAPYIDYNQRAELDQQSGRLLPEEIHGAVATVVHPETALPITLLQIVGAARLPTRPGEAGRLYRSADVLAGLHGQGEPLYFLIIGRQHHTELYLGSSAGGETRTSLQTLLESEYPGVQIANPNTEAEPLPAVRQFLTSCRHAGILTGVPVAMPGEDRPLVGTQLDRLIRGMSGTNWAYLVIAEPRDEAHIIELKLAYFNEQNRLEQEEGFREFRESRASTIAGYYLQMLSQKHLILDSCLFDGGWDVQTYLAAPEAGTYQRLKALVKSTFSGDVSKGVRLRVTDAPDLGLKMASFSPVFAPRPNPPTNELRTSGRNNSKYLTLVSSSILSALIHLPRLEMPGYFVRDAALFDVASHTPNTEKSIQLGQILDRGVPTGNPYRIRLQDLTRHTLLVGITGAGKTNTGFYLLQQLARQDPPIPFLVIEPAKREYRRLRHHPDFAGNLKVFTVGEETEDSAPFRINPFEIHPGVPVQTHIDLLKSVFNASFGMWTPLPQVLERAIISIYLDKGWDPVQNTNQRGEENGRWHPEAQPTLTDLFNKIGELVPSLGYDEEATRNVRTALETRINSLRVGAKGMMLDTSLSIPIETLIESPTVLELEGIGDDDEKVFLMGLILTRLYEHYRTQEVRDASLRHITVIEEAHRLLSNVQAGNAAEVGNPRVKAVETFVNMLSEVRAYGEGFLVAEQIPTKLAPDVIKNTALKLMHRTVSADDRIAMGNAMNLAEDQLRQVVALETGQAVVYGGGKYSDDNPILIRVPLAKEESPARSPEDTIRRRWQSFIRQHDLEDIYAPYLTCQAHCQPSNLRCRQVKSWCLGEALREDFQRALLSLSAHQVMAEGSSSALENSLRTLTQRIRSAAPGAALQPADLQCALTHLGYDFLRRRALNRGWPFQAVTGLAQALLPALASLRTAPEAAAFGDFAAQFAGNTLREHGPFEGCNQLCPTADSQRLCLFQEAAAAIGRQSHFKDAYESAEYDHGSLLTLAGRYANRIIDLGPEAYLARCAGVCFIIQAADADPELSVVSRRNLLIPLIEAAQSPEQEA
jgi:DNA helicase HerA-like ATPase